jgi:hypothetical protein
LGKEFEKILTRKVLSGRFCAKIAVFGCFSAVFSHFDSNLATFTTLTKSA